MPSFQTNEDFYIFCIINLNEISLLTGESEISETVRYFKKIVLFILLVIFLERLFLWKIFIKAVFPS